MKVAALVLAAGASSRLGRPKQLLVFEGKTLVRRAVEAAVDAGCSPVIVVVGRDGEKIAAELAATAAQIVPNKSWASGIGTSIRAGMAKLSTEDAVLILLCDQPRVDAELLSQLTEMQRQTQRLMIACAYAGTIGVPALFMRECFSRLRSLAGDEGAKSLLLAPPGEVATVAFPAAAEDIDTAEDYRRLLEKS